MAINLDDVYANVVAATADYPGGSFKNKSAPGATDGTPLEKDWANDWLGFFQAIIVAGGITPSGAPDTAQASQYLQALQAIFATRNASSLNAGVLGTDRFPTGAVIGYKEVKSAAIIPVSNVIPYDDTIPQQAEGTQIFTIDYTPKKANSLLKLDFFATGEHSNGVQVFTAAFVDANSNAICAEVGSMGSDNWSAIAKLEHTVENVSTTPREYKIRCGVNAGTFYINGQAGNTRVFGGVSYARFSITEIAG